MCFYLFYLVLEHATAAEQMGSRTASKGTWHGASDNVVIMAELLQRLLPCLFL